MSKLETELLLALKDLTAAIDLSRLNVRKDFSLLNAHACATKAIRNATEEGICKHCGSFGQAGEGCHNCEPQDDLGPMIYQPAVVPA